MSTSPTKDGSGHSSSSENDKGDNNGAKDVAQSSAETLYIIVNRGDPVDAFSTRHTAFWIEFADGRNLLTHVCGACGFFEREERWNTVQPQESRHFERIIPVVTAPTPRDGLTISSILHLTPIQNSERAWNCQSFIGDGLKRLQDAKLLPPANMLSAADQMVDVLMEAPDED